MFSGFGCSACGGSTDGLVLIPESQTGRVLIHTAWALKAVDAGLPQAPQGILHARWGGYIRQRGIMAMAIFGNAITAFSWFGVNMLGVGLHSYGFMDKAFPWLLGFVVSQCLLLALTRLPANCWRSYRSAQPRDAKAAGFTVETVAASS